MNRSARHASERLKELGLIDPKWEPAPTVGDWTRVKNKKWEARCMEVYAAMIDNMDQGIGRIVAELKKEGRLDNTLIFFLQDNGGCAEDMGRKPGRRQRRNRFQADEARTNLQIDHASRRCKHAMAAGCATVPA